MATQVGVGEVAIVPTIKGFRRTVAAEVDGTTKQAKGALEKGFASAGTQAGAGAGKGFHSAFSGQTSRTVEQLTSSMRRDVAKASRDVSQARLREQDAAGKVRVAETQLAEVRAKYASDSSQVVRAEERLQTAQRQLADKQDATRQSTSRLQESQDKLATETERVERELRDAADAADEATSDLRQVGRAADDAGDDLAEAGRSGGQRFGSNLSSGIKGAGGLIVGAIAAIGIADLIGDAVRDGLRLATDYISDSVTLASDLEQSIGAVESVFKDSAATIQQWAADGAQSVGLSQGKYQEFATVIGAQLKNLGLPLDDVTQQTGALIGIGSDLAAQFGGDTSQAVEALSSALRGERDPIEKYGVSIKQADVNARLAAEGLSDLEGDALKVAEAQATLALITEQTSDAQGTFARESETLAGQQARLTAEWENAQAKLGTALLPALTELAKVANEELVPILNDLVEEIGPELGSALSESVPAIADMLVELSPLIPRLTELVIDVLPPLLTLFEKIAPLLVSMAEGTGLQVEAWGGLFDVLSGDKSFPELGAQILGVDDNMGIFMKSLAGATQPIQSFFSGVGRNAQQMGLDIGVGVGNAVRWVQSLPRRAGEALSNAGEWLRDSGRALIDGFIKGIRDMISAAGDAAGEVVDWVRGFFPNSPAKRGPLAGAGWSRLRDSGSAFVEQWSSGLDSAFGDVPLSEVVRTLSVTTLTPATGEATSRSSATSAARVVTQNNTIHMTDRDPRIVLKQTGRALEEALNG